MVSPGNRPLFTLLPSSVRARTTTPRGRRRCTICLTLSSTSSARMPSWRTRCWSGLLKSAISSSDWFSSTARTDRFLVSPPRSTRIWRSEVLAR